MNALEPVRGTLPETPTHFRREWLWEPAAEGEYTDGRIGTLTIHQTKGRRVLRTQIDRYAVQPDSGTRLPEGVRALLLENDDPERRDPAGPYRCVVGSDARGLVHDRCNCRAGQCKTDCKHVAALNRLIADEVL